MRVHLTPDIVRKAKPGPSRAFLWDAVVPGLGLVVHPGGTKTWVFQGRATGGRRRSIRASGLIEARKKALLLKAGIDDGPVIVPVVQPAPSTLTVNALIDAWLSSMSRRPVPPVSFVRIRACMDNHVRPKIGSIELAQLSRAQVLAVRDGLAARGLRGMANQVTAYIKAALRWAEDARLIPEAPKWRLPRLRLGSRAHALTDEQWASLMRVLRDNSLGLHSVGRLALRALVLTGCRKNEIAALRRDAVMPDGSLLLIRHKTSARSGPKRVPGADELSDVLRDAQYVVEAFAAIQPTLKLQRALLDSPYVFPSIARNAMGAPISRVLDDTWAEVRRLAELPETMTIHGIRAAFITQAQRLGIPIGTVAAMVGHESALTTLKHYTAPTHSEVAMNAKRVSGWISSRTASEG